MGEGDALPGKNMMCNGTKTNTSEGAFNRKLDERVEYEKMMKLCPGFCTYQWERIHVKVERERESGTRTAAPNNNKCEQRLRRLQEMDTIAERGG